jgi:type IV pilus assembly protein PilC
MKKAYEYSARDAMQRPEEGLIVSESEDEATISLNNRGMVVLAIEFSLRETVNLIGSRNFDAAGLASYYLGIGLRLKNGMDSSAAISDMKSMPSSSRLKLAAMEMDSVMRSGEKMGNSMRIAGFPERDCAVIQALEQGAKADVGFENLSEDYRRNHDINRKIKGMLLEPAFIGVVGIVGVWVTMVYGVPIYERAFKQMSSTGAKIPSYVQIFYGFSNFFDAHVIIASVLYYLFFFSFVMFLKSKVFKKGLDMIGTMRRFSEMVDNAALWGSFRLLIDTQLDAAEIPFMLARSAHRSDSRDSFETMGRLVSGGAKYSDAIRRSGFPEYISKDAASAMSAPGIDAQTQSLDMMRNILTMRVSVMAEKVVTVSKIITFTAAGLLVLTIAMLTFMPIMISEMSML